MPTPHLLLVFVLAVTALMLIPGPNVALIVANSVRHGPRYGLLTVAGTTSAMMIQLALTAFGMTELLVAMGNWFGWLRWAGVAYLIVLGIRYWREPAADLQAEAEPRSIRLIYTRAFFVSLTNPKTLFFYGAFFPQFIVPSHSVYGQLAVLSAAALATAWIVDGSWALIAGKARRVLARYGRLRNRLTGGLLIGAGMALAAARGK